MSEISLPKYSKAEEIMNAVTHGIGIALSIAGLVILVVFAAIYGDAWKVVSSAIYGASMIVLYTASTLYHSFSKTKAANMVIILGKYLLLYILLWGG